MAAEMEVARPFRGFPNNANSKQASQSPETKMLQNPKRNPSSSEENNREDAKGKNMRVPKSILAESDTG